MDGKKGVILYNSVLFYSLPDEVILGRKCTYALYIYIFTHIHTHLKKLVNLKSKKELYLSFMESEGYRGQFNILCKI